MRGVSNDQPQAGDSPPRIARRNEILLVAVSVLFTIASSGVLFIPRASLDRLPSEGFRWAARILLLGVPAAAIVACARCPLGLSKRSRALLLAALCALSWAFADLHHTNVDTGLFVPGNYANNTVWQQTLNRKV